MNISEQIGVVCAPTSQMRKLRHRGARLCGSGLDFHGLIVLHEAVSQLESEVGRADGVGGAPAP